MRKFSEYMLSEQVTAVITGLVVIGVVFGMFVGGQRDTMVERAQASIDMVEAQLAAAAKTSAGTDPVACDSTLIAPELLANDYLPLTLQPTPLHPLDLSKGYGPGVFVSSHQKEDGDDTYVSANALYKILKKDHKDELRGIKIEKKEKFIQYSILLSTDIVCKDELEPLADIAFFESVEQLLEVSRRYVSAGLPETQNCQVKTGCSS